MPAKPPVIIDTSAFFAGIKKPHAIVGKGERLSTIDLIVPEFTKVMDDEIDHVRGSGNVNRAKTLQRIREMLPLPLAGLEIGVVSHEFSSEDVGSLYSMVSKGLHRL